MKKTKLLIKKIIFVLAVLCCAYPLVASLYESHLQKNAISTYESAVEKDKVDTEKVLKDAEDYNKKLWELRGGKISTEDNDFYSDENYRSQLNFGIGDIMANIEIPKINVNIPIYHGTDEDTLKIGIGHLQGSSLPVGGENTRSVLTGHRGLPNSKLFTRLDEIEKDDLFYINVGNETLCYQVTDIEVIEPEEADRLDTVAGRDLVSLVTCTPYGLNTHRLVVTGERIPYDKVVRDGIESEMMSGRELLFAVLPFIFIALALGSKIRDFLRKRKGDKINAE